MKRLGRGFLAALGCLTMVSAAEAVTLEAGDVIEIAFSVTPRPGETTNTVVLELTRTDINLGTPPSPVPTAPSILTATLSDGGSVLGSDTRAPLVDVHPGGGASYQFLWTSAATGLGPAVIVDMASFVDGSQTGLITLTLVSGAEVRFRSAILVDAGQGSVGMVGNGADAAILSVTRNGRPISVPEVGTLGLAALGLGVVGASRFALRR